MPAPFDLQVVLGGTFDPIHRGHLRLARAAASQLKTPVRLMPAADPVHRQTPGASIGDRLAMLELAIADDKDLILDDTEILLGPPTYTARTLLYLRQADPQSAPVWLLGSDAFRGLERWRRYPEVLDLGHFAFVERPGDGDGAPGDALVQQFESRLTDDVEQLRQRRGGLMVKLELDLVEQNATAIRRAIDQDRSIRDWVPDPVADYIGSRGLYR